MIASLVSIIMPAYNAEKYIQVAIDSVLAQTFSYWELIVINDGSTDSTALIVEQNCFKDERIKLLNQTNKKQAAARNLGIKESKGEWLAFIDSDDLWERDKLEKQLNAGQGFDVVFTSGRMFYEHEKKYVPYPSGIGTWNGADMYVLLCHHNTIPNLAVLMKSSWVDKIGLQDERLEVVGCEDWDYWIRLARNGARFCGLSENLFTYRIHDEGTSRNKIKMMMSEAHILFKNIDYKLIDRQIFAQRMSNLISRLEFDLLVANCPNEALFFARMQLHIKYTLDDYCRFLIITTLGRVRNSLAIRAMRLSDTLFSWFRV